MKEEYDFSTARRGSVASNKGKTRITIMLDDDVIDAARQCAESAGTGYQTLINNLLRQALVPQAVHALTTVPQKKSSAVKPYANGVTRADLKDLEKRMSSLIKELHNISEQTETEKLKA